MSAVFIRCPFCGKDPAEFTVSPGWLIDDASHGRYPPEANCTATGMCYWCRNRALLILHAEPISGAKNAPPIIPLGGLQRGKKRGRDLIADNWRFRCIHYYPEPERMEMPADMPDHVSEIFKEADANFLDRRWRSAVTCYGTTIDIAAADFSKDDPNTLKTLTLGQKMKALREQETIPESLVNFMEAINVDRIASTHYSDPVDAEMARAARSATMMLLEYLYSMPHMIEAARERLRRTKGNLTS